MKLASQLLSYPGPRLNIKTAFSRDGYSHVKDGRETVLCLTWDPYTGKTVSLY